MADSNLSLSEHRLESVFLVVAVAVMEGVLVLVMVVGRCVLWQHSHNEEQGSEERKKKGRDRNGLSIAISLFCPPDFKLRSRICLG